MQIVFLQDIVHKYQSLFSVKKKEKKTLQFVVCWIALRVVKVKRFAGIYHQVTF